MLSWAQQTKRRAPDVFCFMWHHRTMMSNWRNATYSNSFDMAVLSVRKNIDDRSIKNCARKKFFQLQYVYTWNHPSWRLPKSTLQSSAAKWSSRLFSCQSTTSVERITGYRQHFIIDDKIADKKFMASQIPTRELGKTYYRKEGLYANTFKYLTKAVELGDVEAHQSKENIPFRGRGCHCRASHR